MTPQSHPISYISRMLRAVLFICLLPLISTAQAGKHGPAFISSAITVNEYTPLTSDAIAGSSVIAVSNSFLNANGIYPANLTSGDLIFIVQMQGAAISTPDDSTYGAITSYGNCGNYELAEVASVPNSVSIALSCPLENSYSVSGKTQVVRVPRFTTIDISAGGSITVPAWNGTIGGVLVAEATGNITISNGGMLDANGKGFRGGQVLDNLAAWGVLNYHSVAIDYGAEKGESIAGDWTVYDSNGGRYCKGAPANGGGGANSHNSGGGGGSNGGIITGWSGKGVPDLSTAAWASAWNLEYSGFATSSSPGGGKGGYTFSATNENALSVGPFNLAWGGDQRRDGGGRGGRPLDYSGLKMFMGGGGGAGDQNNGHAGPGGAGGGLIYVFTQGDISGSGQIRANGANGSGTIGTNGTDGAGGGGGGGSVVLNALGNISGVTINAKGGNGGSQSVSAFVTEAEGPGGGGGGGYIAVSNGTPVRNTNGGNNGTTNSYGLTEFIPNGATKGGQGTSTAMISNFRMIVSPVTTCGGTTAVISASTQGTIPPGTVFNWYDQSAGGTVLGTGLSFTTPVLSASTVYYLGSCPGHYRIPVTVTVNTITASTTASAVCQGDPTIFSGTATASAGTIQSWQWNFGDGSGSSSQQSPSYTYSAAGNYTATLTVTNSTGCTMQVTQPVTVQPAPNINFSTSSASGCSPFSVTFTNTTTSANSFSWDFGDGGAGSSLTSPSHTYTATGSYSVTLTASNGSCTASQTQSSFIQVSPRPLASFSFNNNLCLGDTVYFLDNSSGNGGTITSYSWDFGDGSPLSSLISPYHVFTSPGNFSATLTVNTANCPDDTTVQIHINPAPVAGFSASSSTGCGSLNVNFSNTTTGFPTYSWNFGDGSSLSNAVSPSHLYTTPGTYTVTLMATQGSCSDTLTMPSYITIYAQPVSSFSSSGNVCLGDSVFFTNNSSGNGSTLTGYSWDFGDGSAPSSAMNPSHLYSTSGNFSVTLTASSTNCSDDTTIVVNVAPAPQVSFSAADTSGCGSTSIQFQNQTTGNPAYTWNFGDGSLPSSLANPSHVYSAPGIYNVSLLAVQGSCTDADTLTGYIHIYPQPSASFSATNVCLGDTSFFTNLSSGNGTVITGWQWDFGDGSSTVTAANPSHLYSIPGTYYVQLTAATGNCSDDTTITVNVSPAPVVNFSASPLNGCGPLTVVFNNTSTGSPVYSWDFGDGSTSQLLNPSHTYTSAGNYPITLVATQGSCGDTLTIMNLVTVKATPIAAFATSPACFGDSVLFSNSSQSNGTLISGYAWNFGDGSSGSGMFSPSHYYNTAGNYQVSLIVSSGNGCSDTVSQQVSVLPVPSISFTPSVTEGCDTLTVQFQNSTTGASQYQWSFGDGGSDTGYAPVHFYSAPGSYNVLLTASTSGGCSSSKAFIGLIQVRETPMVNFTASRTSVCPGECIAFTGQSGTGILSWQWSFTGANPSSASVPSPGSVCYPDTGTYPVSLLVSDGHCDNTEIKNAFIHVVDCSAMPVAGFVCNDSVLCGGSCVSFVSLSLNATSWEWSFPGAVPQTSSMENPTGICYANPGNYPVVLIAGNATGQDTITANGLIQVFSPPSAPVITQSGNLLVSTPAVSYQWYLNGIPLSGANAQQFPATLSGNYSVEISDNNGCTAVSSTVFVTLTGIAETGNPPLFYLFPNPVTDHLSLLYTTEKTQRMHIKIFDNTGRIVFSDERTIFSNEWYFTISCTHLSSGVYLFRAENHDFSFSKPFVKQ